MKTCAPEGFEETETEPVPGDWVGVAVGTWRVSVTVVVVPLVTYTLPVQSWNPESEIRTWWFPGDKPVASAGVIP
jgi:hypothetical protein